MKKLIIILSILIVGVGAGVYFWPSRERPLQTADMVCVPRDADFQMLGIPTKTTEFEKMQKMGLPDKLQKQGLYPFFGFGDGGEERYISAEIYNDKAIIEQNGWILDMVKVSDSTLGGPVGYIWYEGDTYNNQFSARFTVYYTFDVNHLYKYDSKHHKINGYTLRITDNNHNKEYDYICYNQLPLIYKTEHSAFICGRKVYELARCNGDCVVGKKFAGISVQRKDGEWMELTAGQARKISPKWDYTSVEFQKAVSDNNWFYGFDYIDACGTLDKIQSAITEIENSTQGERE